MKKTLALCLYWLAFFVLSSVITIVSIITFSFSEKLTMNLTIILALVFVCITFWVVGKGKLSLKYIVMYFIGTFIAFQYVLLALTPNHSFLPEKTLIKLGIVERYDFYSRCPSFNNYKDALFYFGDRIDGSVISIHTYGYVPFPKVLLARASTWGNYIYVHKDYACNKIKTAVYIHELTHVWQYQDGQGFGLAWIPKWINYYWLYFTNVEALYNNGNENNLRDDIANGKTFREYNLEQQAMLVQDYYTGTMINRSILHNKTILIGEIINPIFHFNLKTINE